MIDNTALLKARVKMLIQKNKKQMIEPDETELKKLREARKKNSPNFHLYNVQAHEILQNITELRDLVLDKRKEYILCSGSLTSAYSQTSIMSEADRRRFDNDSDTAMKQCSKLVQYFETQISSDKALRKDDEYAHLKLVAHLLCIYLKEICRLIAQLRAIYTKKAEYVRKICRLANLVDMYEAKIVESNLNDKALNDDNERRQRLLLSQRCNSLASNEIKNRDELRLKDTSVSEKETKKVRVYDFTGTAKKPKAKKRNSKVVDGWDDFEDDLVSHENANGSTEEGMITPVSSEEQNSAERQSLVDGWADAEFLDTKLTDDQNWSNNPIGEADDEKENYNVGLSRSTAFVQRDDPDSPPLIPPQMELSRVEQQQLVVENRKLYDKFAQSDEDILAIGQQLSEIEQLQHTFAEKVTEQEHDIDVIHTQAIHTLDNLDEANEFVRQAIKNTASRRVIALFCLIVLTFTLLFLDWYNP